MTEERSCTLRGVPVLARAYLQGVDAGTDMLALMQAVPEAPHPDFAARAAIWREQRAGLISLKEAQRRSAAVGTVPTTSQTNQSGQGRGGVPRPPVARPRHERPSPNDSRQYAQPMATTAARDDRLTPNAKAFLQVLRARCGKGRETSITKGTAGNIMARSTRTIRRYLVDLVRFGYVELEILRNGRGLHLGPRHLALVLGIERAATACEHGQRQNQPQTTADGKTTQTVHEEIPDCCNCRAEASGRAIGQRCHLDASFMLVVC